MFDPNYGSVSLLLHADGTNASTTFKDSSLTPKAITAVGNAQISTAQSKWGGASAYFDGTGDYLSTPSNAAFDFGTGDYTIELFIRVPALADDALITRYTTWNTSVAFRLVTNAAGAVSYAAGNNTPINIMSAGGTIAINTWHHIAVTCASGTTRIFVDGVSVASTATTATISSTSPLYIGFESYGAGSPFTGYMDDIRITKGVARYTAGFTPPTAAFTEGIAALLLNCDGTNGSTTFVDSSTTPKTVTAAGNAQISTTQSKFGGASAYFDGTGDTLSVPYSNDFTPETDYTIEAWFYKAASGAFCLVSNRNVGNINFHVFVDTIVSIDVIPSGGILSITGVTTVTLNTWHHIAVTRSGNTWSIFLDGTSEATGTMSGTFTVTSQPLIVGASHASYYWNGYIDDLRILKGMALYTADFTPPTSALVADPLIHPAEHANADLIAPAATVVAYGGAYAALAAPSATLAASCGGYATLSAPSPTLRATGHNSYGEQAAILTAPSPTLTAYCGGHSALTAPSPVLTVTATVVNLATASLTAPSPTVAATGVVTQTAAASLSAPIGTLIGYSGAVCSITVGCGTITATGTTGSVGHAALTCPLFELAASATAQNHGSALLTAPSGRLVTGAQAYLVAPSATLTAIGTAVVTATYEAYALNLNHSSDTNDELTHYTNFPFTHIVRYKNSYYGASSTGLYLLEGTTDDGDAIDWNFKTGMTDFDSPQNKTVTYAYFGGRLGPDATVSIYPGEPTGTSYSYTTPRGQYAQNYRQKFGKGLKARYFAIGASGSDVLELDSIDLTVATLTRRI